MKRLRHPMPCLDHRPTPAIEARLQLLRTAGAIVALGLVVIAVLVPVATR